MYVKQLSSFIGANPVIPLFLAYLKMVLVQNAVNGKIFAKSSRLAASVLLWLLESGQQLAWQTGVTQAEVGEALRLAQDLGHVGVQGYTHSVGSWTPSCPKMRCSGGGGLDS